MKAFISIDLEGLPFIVSREHLTVKGALYNEARRIATRVVLTVVEELHAQGVDDIRVADSHGPMVNILPEEMPEYVSLLRGFPRPVCMVNGIEKSDFVVFLGYHAKAGTAHSTFDHTYSGSTIASLELNGIPVSEFLLNTYFAGHFDVHVALVAGSKALIEDDVKKFTPWAEYVILKQSTSRYGAWSPSMKVIEKELKKATVKGVQKFSNNMLKPLKLNYPIDVSVEFLSSAMADIAELLPGTERLGGRKIKFQAKDIVEAYKTFELLVMAVRQ
ncbi:MAG: M55 family metallopeptidase [Candidatus Odinarchaeota archaeon]|nr:M55 family metallopeptidase [Candidatus Odinarchaeota archaeon]